MTPRLPADLRGPLLHAFVHRLEWLQTARPNQITPPVPHEAWLILAGRGFGKTRTGAEETAFEALMNPGIRCAVVAPTAADVIDTCFEGESGLLAVIPEQCIADYVKSPRPTIKLFNGSIIKGFTAERPNRLRGPQHHFAWCDELAAWQYLEAWDQLLFGLRLTYPDGTQPRVIITTTPRPIDEIKHLVERAKKGDGVAISTGSTFDNADHLSPRALARLREKYEGTRLGRQELFAEILDDLPGALWTRDMLARQRTKFGVEIAITRTVVAVDPAVSNTEKSDETGIIIAGTDAPKQNGYVLADESVRDTANAWAARAVELYHAYDADAIVAEVNQGGDLVEAAIRAHDRNIRVITVRAVKNKQLRAEPVAALYEQGRVFHCGHFPHLEDQLCLMAPDGYHGTGSPDRVDALVYALTELMLREEKPRQNVRVRYV